MQKSMTKIIKENKGLFIGGASLLAVLLIGLIFLLVPKNDTTKKITQENETTKLLKQTKAQNESKNTDKTSESNKDSVGKEDKKSDEARTSPNENKNQSEKSEKTVVNETQNADREAIPSQPVSFPVVVRENEIKQDEKSINQPVETPKQINPTTVPVSTTTTQTTTKQVVQEQPKPQSVHQPTVNPENEPLKINGTVWVPKTPHDKVFYSEAEAIAYAENGISDEEFFDNGYVGGGWYSAPSNKNGGTVYVVHFKK